MQVGDLVQHKLSGVGVIIGIEASESDYKVRFTNGKLWWVDSRLLEVISENR